MTWTLEGIQLPIPPRKFKKKTTRSSKIVSTIDDFPNPNTSQPTKFSLQLEGLIWPLGKARALDEAGKNAESDEFLLYVTDDAAQEEPWLTGLYAVNNAEVSVDKPMFTNNGDQVFKYKITLAKYADAGSTENGDEGESDDDGTGFLDMGEDVGFDEEGDGKIGKEEFFNWFNNIQTFGIFD